jgi:hypothetical protein
MTGLLPVIALVAGVGPFLKGQLHLHTSNSADSTTPPADVVRWYAAHGYDFIVVTDHNRITVERSPPSLLVIPGVELTQNVERCEPPPLPGLQCLLHVNALFVTPPPDGRIPWPAVTGSSRLDIYRRALGATRRLGGIAQINHPNFHYAANPALITALVRSHGLSLVEIANRSWDSNDVPAEKGHPSTEAMWDAVLTEGADVFGTATDDAHHYNDAAAVGARGEATFPGDLGFVMVRAAREPAAIRAALAAGNFYASTGVLLARVDRTADHLEIEVADRSPGPHRFTFIGTRGRVLARATGRRAKFPLADAQGGYVRADIEDSAGRRAWTQPIRVPAKPVRAHP